MPKANVSYKKSFSNFAENELPLLDVSALEGSKSYTLGLHHKARKSL